MIRIVVVCLAMMFGTMVRAQDAGPIQTVISDQMAAFVARDLDRAFSHASPTIKGFFGNSAAFGAMVERGYPMVWDNSDIRFLDLREVEGRLWQQVMVRDAFGGLHMLDYWMVETAAGWQINAVQLLPAPDVGA